MRDDKNLSEEIVESKAWDQRNQRFTRGYVVGKDEDGKAVARVHPFSAGERNAFFSNLKGEEFVDLSALSGADSPADSRSFAYFDYDRDGDHDFVQSNANSPGLELYKTQVAQPGRWLAIRLEGNGSSSNRDAIGAFVTVTDKKGRKLVRELRAGEGFAAQNSKELLFGLGEEGEAREIEIRWPSGKTTRQSLADSAHSKRIAFREEG